MIKLDDLLKELKNHKASDLHLKVNNNPFLRIDGTVGKLDGYPALSDNDVIKLANEAMNEEQKKSFAGTKEIDFAISSNNERFRLNIFKEKNNTSIVIRRLALPKMSLEELGLPSVLQKFADAPRGLVLVTGVAGSGKTTTIAALIEWINNNKPANIITVEDPIEIVFEDNKSIIRQRELGSDTQTYTKALKHIVRQDPDVIFIGEVRDYETMDSAMKAAELGNLVLSTLHTVNATETINRVIDLYPTQHQKQARILLSSTLLAIISLRLLPKKGGGRIPAVEILYNTSTTKQYILKPEETSSVKKAMVGGDYYGMQTFNQSLVGLLKEELIDIETANEATESQQDLQLALKDARLA